MPPPALPRQRSSGWDPALAYLQKIVDFAQDGTLSGLNRQRIEEIGAGLTFYDGVPACFNLLKDEVENDPRYRAFGIRVEFYVVSGGIEELIAASPLAKATHAMWACSFSYDPDGKIMAPKRVISFTDKTRFLFLIQKGKVAEEFRNTPYVVNEPMEEDERPIPFRNMIYIGDGPSDIPCMSLVRNSHGFVMGILSKEKPYKTWALGFGRRAHLTVPPEFTPGGYAFEQLKQAIVDRAEAIRAQLSNARPVPGH